MVIMLVVTYPAAKAQECGQAYIDLLKANPFPDYVKLIEDYQCWGGDGIKGYVYYNLDKGKEQEGERYITSSTLELAKMVDGFRVLESTVVSTLADAYETVGMQAPAV
jgi:hypothetical protein